MPRSSHCDYAEVLGYWLESQPMANRPNNLEQERIWIEKSKEDTRHIEPLYNKYFDPLFRYFFEEQI